MYKGFIYLFFTPFLLKIIYWKTEILKKIPYIGGSLNIVLENKNEGPLSQKGGNFFFIFEDVHECF